MAALIHEIWEDVEEGGITHTCCLNGPLGDGARNLLGPNARLLTTFEANSHFEAMTIYNHYLGYEPYRTDFEEDYLPYPDGGNK